MTAKLFQNGSSQAVRLPKEYRFEGEEVYINRIGNMVVLIPKDDPWRSLLDSLGTVNEDFLANRDQGTYEPREQF
jgi:antitoxin VapB